MNFVLRELMNRKGVRAPQNSLPTQGHRLSLLRPNMRGCGWLGQQQNPLHSNHIVIWMLQGSQQQVIETAASIFYIR